MLLLNLIGSVRKMQSAGSIVITILIRQGWGFGFEVDCGRWVLIGTGRMGKWGLGSPDEGYFSSGDGGGPTYGIYL